MSENKKKPSGYEYRKRRLAKEKEQKCLEGSLNKFLKLSRNEQETNNEENKIQYINEDIACESLNAIEDENIENLNTEYQELGQEVHCNNDEENRDQYTNLEDPANWPHLLS